MASLAMRAFLRTPKREPRRATPTPALEPARPEPETWDAVVERLRASWESSAAPGEEAALYLAGWPEDLREAFEERAGVLEDGGLSREEAERRALGELRGRNVHNVANGNVSGGTAA